MDNRWTDEPSPFLRFLKVMYYAGYLPFNWTGDKDSDQVRFEISLPKTILVIFFDFFMAMFIPAHAFLWHWLNISGFDLTQLLSPKYYVECNDGSVTTSICQLVYVSYPFFIFWIHGFVGKLLISIP